MRQLFSQTTYTSFKFKHMSMNVHLGCGPFWTQGGLLMGPTRHGYWVILVKCTIFGIWFSSILGLLEYVFKSTVTRVGQTSEWSYRTTPDDRIPTIYSILPNDFLGISERSRGKPRNFRFLMQTICRLAEFMP